MDTAQSNSQFSLPAHLEMFALQENPSLNNRYLRLRLSRFHMNDNNFILQK